MYSNSNLLRLVPLIAICLSVTAAQAQDKSTKPKVVYIMADDVGWGDLNVHDGDIPTPNIDRLFSRGVELTQFMGWCVCSPTRAMLLIGRHPIRVGTGPEVSKRGCQVSITGGVGTNMGETSG